MVFSNPSAPRNPLATPTAGPIAGLRRGGSSTREPRGRLPYFIAGQNDGHGLAHYTMSARSDRTQGAYFRQLEAAFTDIARLCSASTWLVSLLSPVVGCSGPRGAVQPSNGGYAVLGQLVADLTDTSYTDAVTRLVLDPIGLTGATLPTRDTDLGLDTVTGYQLTGDGVFQPAAMICTIPAVGGLWATPADLVRLGLGWTRLLPAELVQEALTAQTPLGAGGRAMGLGWLLSPDRDVGLHAGVRTRRHRRAAVSDRRSGSGHRQQPGCAAGYGHRPPPAPVAAAPPAWLPRRRLPTPPTATRTQ